VVLETLRRVAQDNGVVNLRDEPIALASMSATEHAIRQEERARIAAALGDTVIHDLFATGLQLQSMGMRTDGERRRQLFEVVDQLDDVIRSVREAIYPWAARATHAGPAGVDDSVTA